MAEPTASNSGEDQPMSEAQRPPWSGEGTAEAQQIAAIGRLAEDDETLSGRACGVKGSEGQAGEAASNLSRGRGGLASTGLLLIGLAHGGPSCFGCS